MDSKYKVGDIVKYSVMGDLYDFRIIMSDGTGRYMLKWTNGSGGTIWVNKDDISLASGSVGNRSVKRMSRKQGDLLSVLASLIILGVVCGLILILWTCYR